MKSCYILGRICKQKPGSVSFDSAREYLQRKIDLFAIETSLFVWVLSVYVIFFPSVLTRKFHRIMSKSHRNLIILCGPLKRFAVASSFQRIKPLYLTKCIQTPWEGGGGGIRFLMHKETKTRQYIHT